jgi:acyl carrier protein
MKLTEDQLLKFLRDSLDFDDDIDAETELFSSGDLDSVAMLELITFVEKAAGFEVSREDVTLENFDTVARIVRYATSKD